ncbi:MAG: lipoprotein-releasing ABC transporter permease subunit [Idiomarina sp.]|nr:lipoprotein-releasing ABC transporter permease subunit [Idiomarina sp.]
MFRPTELFLALRYSRSRRRAGFAAFISRVSMFGILLGVMALVVVTSVMNGFEGELKDRILGVVPQVTLTQTQQTPMPNWQTLDAAVVWPRQVVRRTPFVSAEGVVQGQSDLQPVLLQGIFPEFEGADSVLRDLFISGQVDDLQAGQYGIVIGRALAIRLGLWVGDRIRITAAAGQHSTPLGMMPAQRQFTIVGLFEAGSDVDKQVVFLHGRDAARLFRYPDGQVTGIRLYLNDAFQAGRVANALNAQSIIQEQDVFVEDWSVRYGRLFSAVQMEKTMMVIMLGLVVVVAVFNAVSALVMLVRDKRGDIAVLQTLGLSPRRIYVTLVLQGMYTGVVGVVTGVLLGVLLTVTLNPILAGLGVSVFSYGELLPYDIQLHQVSVIAVVALVLTLLSTLYPAWRAARVLPAETLRYE